MCVDQMTFFEGGKQVELAIDEADVIIFVVDVEEGITLWMILLRFVA
jgi:predicted GTPase